MTGQHPLPPPPITVLRGHDDSVQALCYLSKKLLFSGCQDGCVKVWDVERRRVSKNYRAHSPGFGILRLDVLNGNTVVSQGRDGVIKLWDINRLVDTGIGATSGAPVTMLALEPVQTIRTGAFHFCQFALDRWRKRVAGEVASEDTESKAQKPSEERRRTESVAVNIETGKNLSKGQEECVADAGDSEGQTLMSMENETSIRESASQQWGSFSTNVLAAPTDDQHTVQLWDLRTNSPSMAIKAADADRRGMLMCVRMLSESAEHPQHIVVCGHDNGSLCVYDVRATSHQPLMDARLHKEPVLCMDINSTGRRGVTGSADSDVHVFRLDYQQGNLDVVKTFSTERPGTACVEIRPDQKLFISGGWDHRVRVFALKERRRLAVLRSHEGSVYSIAYGPQIGDFATGGKDSRICLWELYPAAELAR